MGLNKPFVIQGMKAATPHNSNNEPNGPFKGIRVGVAGTISVAFVDGSVGQFDIDAKVNEPCEGIRINSTGTTATGIILLY